MVFEANYDEKMLDNGGYPAHLKNRIKANTGHLSNDQAGVFLAENFNVKMKNIFLCHLSRENNLPEVAFTTIENHLLKKNIKVGVDVQMITLERFTPSELYIFD